MENEEYLGGFTSANLKRGIIAGYGVYATSRRIIGIKKRAAVIAGAAITGGLLEYFVMRKFTNDESAKAIGELEAKKDFEVFKEHISSIEIKKPSIVGWGGYLKIMTALKETTEIAIMGKKEFEQARTLMTTFYPDRVKIL